MKTKTKTYCLTPEKNGGECCLLTIYNTKDCISLELEVCCYGSNCSKIIVEDIKIETFKEILAKINEQLKVIE